jgi:uncharacterized protein YjiS (DUF1127 family)
MHAHEMIDALHKCIADASTLHSIFQLDERIRTSTTQTITVASDLLEETTMNPIRIAKSWINYRRTVAELGSLSNHALNDIGITRYDIRNIAARSFR